MGQPSYLFFFLRLPQSFLHWVSVSPLCNQQNAPSWGMVAAPSVPEPGDIAQNCKDLAFLDLNLTTVKQEMRKNRTPHPSFLPSMIFLPETLQKSHMCQKPLLSSGMLRSEMSLTGSCVWTLRPNLVTLLWETVNLWDRRCGWQRWVTGYIPAPPTFVSILCFLVNEMWSHAANTKSPQPWVTIHQ